MDVFTFLGSDTALVASIAIAAYAFMTLGGFKAGMLPWDFLPATLYFAWPWMETGATLIFYGAALYFLLPFLVGLGFPVIYTLIICLAYVYTKAFNMRLEYGAAFSLLTVILLGTGF